MKVIKVIYSFEANLVAFVVRRNINEEHVNRIYAYDARARTIYR